MPLTHERFLDVLINHNTEQIRQAGQRYTPGIDPQAPNLKIVSLLTAIENVACGIGALARFQKVIKKSIKVDALPVGPAWDGWLVISERRKGGGRQRELAEAGVEGVPFISLRSQPCG